MRYNQHAARLAPETTYHPKRVAAKSISGIYEGIDMKRIPKDMLPGTVHETNNYGRLSVIEYRGWDKVLIEFVSTGSKLIVSSHKIRTGQIKDNMRPSVYGVGFIGNGEYSGGTGVSGTHSREYKAWSAMLKRCYSGKYPTYKDCSVDPVWHNFQNFAEWYHENYPSDGREYELDKDIKIDGNRVYSPDACLFVSKAENTQKARGHSCVFINPNGERIECKSVRQLAIKYSLTLSCINDVKRGLRKQYKGWTKAD